MTNRNIVGRQMKTWTLSGLIWRSAVDVFDPKTVGHKPVSVNLGRDTDKKVFLNKIWIRDVEEELVSWFKTECHSMPRMYYIFDQKQIAFEFSNLDDALRFKLSFASFVKYLS